MNGAKAIHKTVMHGPAGDAATGLIYAGKMMEFFGDLGTEVCVRTDGDGSLFLGYDEVRFTAPVYIGDLMEYHAWLEKKGTTSYKVKFEAYKIMTATEILPEPELCGYATGILIIPKDCQRGPQDPAFAV